MVYQLNLVFGDWCFCGVLCVDIVCGHRVVSMWGCVHVESCQCCVVSMWSCVVVSM